MSFEKRLPGEISGAFFILKGLWYRSTMNPKRRIYAIGNNVYVNDPVGIRLSRYILNQSGKEKPRVCLIPTASGDAESQIHQFESTMGQLPCEWTVLSLFRGENPDLAGIVLNQDVIYVSGGNTRNMLTLWREWGLDRLIRQAYEQGTIFAGGSAGSLCWFEEGVTDSVPGDLTAMKCLGYLKGSNCPHYDGEVNRRPRYHALITNGELGAGLANEDGVALYFENEVFQGAISPFSGKRAYRVSLESGKVVESPIPARLIE